MLLRYVAALLELFLTAQQMPRNQKCLATMLLAPKFFPNKPRNFASRHLLRSKVAAV
jgi:hypothetical protein